MFGSRVAAKLTILALFLTLLGGSRALAADPNTRKAEARDHYEAGARKFDLGRYDEAVVEFQAAYEIVGDPVILYNIAKSYQLAQNPERALFFYKTYLRKVDNPANRVEVQGRIAELTQVVTQSKRATETPPTGILRPGEIHGETHASTTPNSPAKRPPESKPPESRPPEQKPPETAQTTEPPPEVHPETTPESTAAPSSRSKMWKGLGFGLAGLAVASLGVGVAMSLLAGSASSDVQNAAANHGAFDANLQRTESHGQTFDAVSYVGYALAGVAAAGAAVSLYFGLRHPKESAARASVLPFGSPQAGGLAVLGSF